MTETSTPPTTETSTRPSRRRINPLRSAGLLVRIVSLVVVGLLLLAAIGLVAGWRPSLSNPFGSETVDRSSPAVLRSLEDLREYHAASAHFEVVVDLEQDTRWLPGPLSGERVLFVGVGDVDAFVDFAKLEDGALTVSEDRRSVEITLPYPTLSESRVDPDRSYVVSHQEGVLDRTAGLLGGGDDETQELFKTAADKMAAAAQEDGSVLTLAEQNTTNMLKGFLAALGFTDVTVTFEDNPA